MTLPAYNHDGTTANKWTQAKQQIAAVILRNNISVVIDIGAIVCSPWEAYDYGGDDQKMSLGLASHGAQTFHQQVLDRVLALQGEISAKSSMLKISQLGRVRTEVMDRTRTGTDSSSGTAKAYRSGMLDSQTETEGSDSETDEYTLTVTDISDPVLSELGLYDMIAAVRDGLADLFLPFEGLR